MASKMKALQTWCQQKTKGYRDVNVTNMTTSWRDGMAFCALIHHYRPDLIDFDALSKENVLHNNQMAFQIAENELGIAALLDAEDMVAMKVPDKLSVITYVSQYYNILNKMQPGPKVAPMKRAASPPNVKADVKRTNKATEEARPVLTEKVQKFSTCEICKKKVHLVERYIDEGKVYHRHCHRTKSLSGMYRREGSAAMHNYMESVKSPDKQKSEEINPFKAQIEAEKKLKPSPLTISKPTPPKDVTNGKENVEKKSPQKFHVADMASKFSDNKPKSSWSPTKRHSGNPSIDSSKRKSTDSGDFTGNPFETGSDTKSKSSSSTPKHTWTPVGTPTSKSSKSNSAESVNSKQDLNPFEETRTKTDKKPEPKPLDLKENHENETVKAHSDDNNSNSVTESPTKHMLPSLLKSLADVKSQKENDKAQFISGGDTPSPSSTSAPLISELPKSLKQPKAEIEVVSPKPIPRPRSSKGSDTHSDLNYDEVDHQPEINPFQESDSEANADPEANSDEPLNPFGDEEEAMSDEELSEGGNPFGEDEEMYVEKHTELNNGTDNGKKTLNVTGPNENRFNPFTDEYEHKKESKASTEMKTSAPKPPARRKAHAPPPPKPPAPKVETQNTPDKTPSTVVKVPVASPSTVVTPPERRHKRTAPKWKSEMEKKMEQLNDANKTDTRYVNKTPTKSPTPSTGTPKQATQSPSHKNRNSPTKQSYKPGRQAPGFGFPLVKRKVKSQMTEEEIANEMKVLDVQLKDLEKKGVKLEEVLRDDMDTGNDLKPESDQLLSEWFDLVNEKNKLVRRETDLVYLMQQQRLEQQHADVEFQIRKLLNKPDNEKTEEEKEEEAKLVEELVKIVEKRNTIINSIEEERIKEEEEDAAFDMMKKMQRDNPNDSDNTKKKKKNKVKKMFSKRKKEKPQATSSGSEPKEKSKKDKSKNSPPPEPKPKKDKGKVSPKAEQKENKNKEETGKPSPKATKS